MRASKSGESEERSRKVPFTELARFPSGCRRLPSASLSKMKQRGRVLSTPVARTTPTRLALRTGASACCCFKRKVGESNAQGG